MIDYKNISFETFNLLTVDFHLIQQQFEELININNETINDILLAKHHSWDGTILKIHDSLYKINRIWQLIKVLYVTHHTSDIQVIANNIQKKLFEVYTNIFSNRKLYDIYEMIKKTEYHKLSIEQQKVLDNDISTFINSGIKLNSKLQQELTQIHIEINQIQSKFAKNVAMASNNIQLDLTLREKHEIVPILNEYLGELYLARDGSIILNENQYRQIICCCKDRLLRRKLYIAYNYRNAKGEYNNADFIHKLFYLRKQKAGFLNFNTYLEYALSNSGFKNPEEINILLFELIKIFKAKASHEITLLLDLAKADNIYELEEWDIDYYKEKANANNSNDISLNIIKFALPDVVSALSKIINKLFAISLVKLKANPDSELYAVYEQEELIGFVYFDLFARNTKIVSSQTFSIQDRCEINGVTYRPIAYVVCNFLEQELNLKDIHALFHECGHAIHHVVSKVKHCSISGYNGVNKDLLEIPSMLMEYFVYNPNVLNELVEHDKHLLKVRGEKYRFYGLEMLRLIKFSLFDMRFHANCSNVDYMQIANDVSSATSVSQVSDSGNFPYAFLHIFANGYAANFYGYICSEIIALKLYQMLENFDETSIKISFLYKDKILSTGGVYNILDGIKGIIAPAEIFDLDYLHKFYDIALQLSSDKVVAN